MPIMTNMFTQPSMPPTSGLSNADISATSSIIGATQALQSAVPIAILRA